MKIAHYILRYWLSDGGPIRAITDLSNACAARGHEVTLITTDDREAPESWKKNSGPDYSPGTPRIRLIPRPALPLGLFDAAGKRAAEAAIAECDVLHLHGVWVPSALQCANIAQKMRKPYVLSVRGMLDDWCMAQQPAKKRLYLSLGARRMLEKAGWVHCTAEFEFEQARKWFPKGRGKVIPNLMEIKGFNTMPGPELARQKFEILRNGLPAVLFLSRVHIKKGIELLIEASAKLRASGLDHNVMIAGDGEPAYVESLKKHAAQLNMSDRVAFLGMVTGKDKLSLFEACRLFVLPTYQENFGFVFYESLGAAVPMITTPDVDTWPELKASGGALIVERDVNKYVTAMREMLSDPDRCRRMGEAGKAWLFENMDPAKLVTRYEEIYQSAGHR
jgi:glycosyltransferase involved in cell wall biosynthesis